MNLSFIGGGNMANALIGGLVDKGADPRDFRVVDPMREQQDNLAARYPGIGVFGEMTSGAVEGADLVVLAVKPQQMRVAATALSTWLGDDPVVLSIAAGTRMAQLSAWLGEHARIVRAMPNTPAMVGAGISGVFAGPGVDTAGRKLAGRVLEAAGSVLWVQDEAMLDAVTGVSGSGPAYVFYFIEGLEQAARELGFTEPEARRLAYLTFAGAVKLALASDVDPGILRAQVTSKGGTTERGIGVLDERGVMAAFVAAIKAAADRARELGDAEGK